MKIAELAKKLEIKPTDLRQKIADFGIDIGKKARTIKDKTAEEIIKKIEDERTVLEATESAKKSEEKIEKKDQTTEAEEEKTPIEIPEAITVKDFSGRINQPVTEVIKALMKNGVMATINENIDFETAVIIAEEFGIKCCEAKKEETKVVVEEKGPQDIKPRPAVITVMGHVDHGKTTLLDKIRQENVVATESGGITQHIGAYKVNVKTKEHKKERTITFLDTPGHEAFTAMRAHGAKITDIAVLVVAAEDGVKPQTKEAIDHAKAAGVPIIIAINKIDKPIADPQKTKKELAAYGLATEDWGGSTPVVEVSALTGKGIPELLEMILLVADLQELITNYAGNARGVVIEAHKDPKVGPIASILIQKGVLSEGDAIIIDKVYGKIRRMEDDQGKQIDKAYPSDPVKITGLSQVPNFGEIMIVVSSEKEARNLVEKAEVEKKEKKVLGISEVAQSVREGKIKELDIILKVDADGSIAAITDSLAAISTEDVKVKIIRSAVGEITSSDVLMAAASNAIIIGFRVGVTSAAKKNAAQQNIKISNYDVIYQLIDDVYAAAAGLLEPEIVETEVGKLKILAIFTHGKNKKIIGGKVTQGYVEKGLHADIYRESEKIGEGKILNLQQAKKDTPIVEEGFEAGLELETPLEIQEGDKLLAIKKEEIVRKIAK
jgi:translation initiation factor IF-2